MHGVQLNLLIRIHYIEQYLHTSTKMQDIYVFIFNWVYLYSILYVSMIIFKVCYCTSTNM